MKLDQIRLGRWLLAKVAFLWLFGCISVGGFLLSAGRASPEPPHFRYATKSIEDVRVGDTVLAKDPAEPGPPTPHKVIALPRNWTEHIVHITVKGGGEIQSTREHPFFTTNRGWVAAKDLSRGDILQGIDGHPIRVSATRIEDRTCGTFNLTVAGLHTFYVLTGNEAVLVHNQWPDGYLPSPALPGDPYNPQEVDRRRSAWRAAKNSNLDPNSPIPDQSPGYNVKSGVHQAKGGTPHDTGERNVNPHEEHSRIAKGSQGQPRRGGPCP